MPSPEQLEYAELLVRKVGNDLHACSTLAASRESSDDVVGFHAQQAVEKAIKAVLVLHSIEFPRTHDLDFLIELADGNGIDVPDRVREAEWLTPWAAELRYDEPSGRLDREAALATARAAADWAASVLGRRHAD